ncbi:G-type lectin S-receptor-like serine/threonine-protein kinase At1g11280 isoform X2 [Brassica napus]|uniref:G-type lectin S-receptor-like serine/threonine-protein kinase At1g11280 isoform X2 n=1 Tax=Brassica napus TaxID=3708 RepID=UPI0020785F2F|nr:G-type lectin S-receptor-like serine/threonine-protein kinase At1g11280 isoform X2 [Brassica napus]
MIIYDYNTILYYTSSRLNYFLFIHLDLKNSFAHMGVHWREMDVVLFCFLWWLSIFSDCGDAAISRESPLSLGQTLSSPGESYELGFFSPNNSRNQYVGIWFKKITPLVVVWVANREKPITSPAANLTISGNGSLILLDSRNRVVWSSTRGEPSTNKCHAKLLDTGNLVVVDEVSGTLLWQSFENPGDTLLPLSSLTYNLAAKEKRVLTSWKSQTDPSPGEFSVELTPQVPSQLVTMKGNKVYKRSGPWDKTGFTGVPQMDESYASPFSLVQDVANGKGNFSYLQRNSQLLTRVIVTSEGYVKTSHYNGTGWVVDFVTPANKCDIYGACGPFGLCVTSTPIKCECIKGFVPKHKEEWKRGNKTSGCVRRKELSSCRQEATKSSTDAFYRLSNGCLGNCSCTAFAFVTGIGCLLWNQELMDTVQYSAGGEFLSIRLASSELAESRRTMMIISGSICLSIFVILAFASYKYWRYRAKRNAWKSGLEQEEISGLTFFEMNTIRAATDNFKISNKLGQGGFGPVYKGILSDRKEIAVKRLSSSSGQGTEEFMNEIKLISKLQHRNLVRLLGCCIDGEEKLLIYEFMVNKSLDSFLFDSTLKLQIDWPKRFNIIEGVARGLLYLHRDSCLKVIHRDMKVSNILLDENMNPKISDFGLARMFQGTQHQDSTRRVVGTIGYMSPEYAWTGMFSEKSDIYAFGVLLLEIISGMKISSFNCGMEGKTLLEYAWESWLETDGVDLLDQDIASSCSPVEVARCVQIGLLCIQQQAVDRPNIAQVVSMITTTTDLPRPQQPVFALQNHDQESTVSVLESVNHMTQTAIYGR